MNVVGSARSVELFERAIESLQQDDHTLDQALSWLLEAADLGHVEAGFHAALVLRARNRSDDLALAIPLLERAVAVDIDEATVVLSTALILGEGIAPDLVRARALLEPLAARGDADAQFQMSCLVRDAGNQEEALEWELLAGERGHAGACINLAARFASGLEVEPDPERAIALLELAAESGSAEAAARLCAFFVANPAMKRTHDEDERWYERAIELGHEPLASISDSTE
jgi:uncharacterized protein